MPDIETLNAVAAADIASVNAVAKANIATVNGVGIPASGQTATRWVASHDGGGSKFYISYAPHSDRTDWTGTEVQSATPDTYWLAYGKDGSGNPIWATANNSGSMELARDDNNDVTDGSTWVSEGRAKKCRTLAWGNNIWVGIGHMSASEKILTRSADADTWANIDLSGVTNITTATVYGLATDGVGNWMFGQGARIFASTDDAATWAEMDSYDAGTGGAVLDIGFTNNTWVVLDAGDPGQINTVGAAAFATEMDGGSDATWGTQEADDGANTIETSSSGSKRATIACGNGVVIISNTRHTMAFDVNGATISVRASGRVGVGHNDTIGGHINTIATDGNGVWLVGSNGSSDPVTGGDVAESLDNGATWTQVLDDFSFNGDRKFEAIRANVFLPV